MKLLWTALRELRKDAGFVLLLILELSVGICFLASSGALLHRLGQQLTLTRTLHLQDAWWSDTAIESSDLPFYEMPQTMDVALNLDGKEQEAVLSALPAGMEHRLCFDLLMEGSTDELPVVLRDTLAEKDTVGRRYEILLATGEEPLRIRVVGTYAGGIDDFQGDSFSADVISGIYGDMIASQAHPYWDAHPQQAACLQTRQSGVLYFTDDPKQLSHDGVLSLSENWTTSFWSQESNLFSMVAAVVFALLSLSGVCASKMLRMCIRQRQESIYRICGAAPRQRLCLSLLEDTLMFIPVSAAGLLLLRICEQIAKYADRFSSGYISEHPQWEFLSQFCSSLNLESICLSILIYYLIYVLLSVGIHRLMARQSILQLYKE